MHVKIIHLECSKCKKPLRTYILSVVICIEAQWLNIFLYVSIDRQNLENISIINLHIYCSTHESEWGQQNDSIVSKQNSQICKHWFYEDLISRALSIDYDKESNVRRDYLLKDLLDVKLLINSRHSQTR